MNSLERKTVDRTLAQARALGIDVPAEALRVFHDEGDATAAKWAELHPDEVRWTAPQQHVSGWAARRRRYGDL